jgi:hypothetical protein
MQVLQIEVSAVNTELLLSELQAAAGSAVAGVVFTDKVIVTIEDNTTQAAINQIRQVVRSHDATKRTPRQQADLARQTKMESMRRDYAGTDIDLSGYSAQPAIVQRLAQKIAWLEQEIIELRGGVRG